MPLKSGCDGFFFSFWNITTLRSTGTKRVGAAEGAAGGCAELAGKLTLARDILLILWFNRRENKVILRRERGFLGGPVLDNFECGDLPEGDFLRDLA